MANNDDIMKDDKRLPTCIPGLDTILDGGVLPGGIYIIQGVPGAGKTIFGNQVCFAQAAAGRRALYVTLLAESHSRMMGHMRRLNFFNESAIPDNVSFVGAFKTLEEEGLRGLLDLVRREVRARKCDVVVLDGLITVNERASSDLELKKFVHELQTQAVFSGCTMFLLTSVAETSRAFPPEHTMVDGLIELKIRVCGRRAERELHVHKLRGSGFLGGAHSYRITQSGISVFPRTEAVLAWPDAPDRVNGTKITTGVTVLDDMLDGGPDQYSVTLIAGPAGSGKTTLGLHFLSAAAEDEPALLFGFHESENAIRYKTRAMGLPFAAMLDSGRACMMWRPQTELLVDEVVSDLLDAVRTHKIRRLFIDGADGFESLVEDKSRVSALLTALCNELRGLGVTTIATAETDLAGIAPGQPLAGLSLIGLSPVAENIVVLRTAATRSEVHRLVSVVKARDSRVDLRMRRFEIGKGGIVIDSNSDRAEAVFHSLQGSGPKPKPASAREVGD